MPVKLSITFWICISLILFYIILVTVVYTLYSNSYTFIVCLISEINRIFLTQWQAITKFLLYIQRCCSALNRTDGFVFTPPRRYILFCLKFFLFFCFSFNHKWRGNFILFFLCQVHPDSLISIVLFFPRITLTRRKKNQRLMIISVTQLYIFLFYIYFYISVSLSLLHVYLLYYKSRTVLYALAHTHTHFKMCIIWYSHTKTLNSLCNFLYF